MDHLRAKRVGTEFVRHYYTLLHKDPLQLHRFYLDQSSFVHASGSETNDEPVVGQKRIHEKIQSLRFVDCRTTIRQTNSLPTVENAIVVQVCGEISNNGGPMRPFVQTFVLSPESPKKYYVRNDIFRYQDEIWEPVAADSTAHVNDVIEVSEPPTTTAADDSPAEHTTEESAETSAVGAPPADEEEEEEEEEEAVVVQEKPVEPQKHFSSWANVAASSTAASKRVNTSNPPPGISASQRERPPTRRQANPVQGLDGPKVVNQAPVQTASISQQQGGGGSGPPQRGRYPDTHQIFIGSLAASLTDHDIKAEFSKWGNVIDVRRHPKHFGFVIFDGPQPVQKLLKHVEAGNQIMINNTRVNLEEKKSPNRGGPGTRRDGGVFFQNQKGNRYGGRGDGSRR